MGGPRGTPAERLWRRVDKSAGPDGCWLWTASCNVYGYGQISVGGRNGTMMGTHRLAYELSTGKPIPAGMDIDHRCFARRCCNPQHLRLVTPKQHREHRQGAQRNSLSGIRGVRQAPNGRWRARAKHNGKDIHVGIFDTEEEAAEAARLKRNELFTHNDADRR